MITASPGEAVKAPFPGLRAFEAHESLLFFGREVQVEGLLDGLGENHFVAVIGTSGSGKSSLVKAGLGPALHRGYLLDATTRWRLATMRPGGSPIEHMATALAPVLNVESRADIVRSLRTTSNGLVTAVAAAGLSRDENLLIIADQFEELFRYDVSLDQRTDAALFVSQLLEATEQRTTPIYVVVTMRSEFLGRCSEFTGLAEAFNRSQFLVPRLTRDERHQAIERPLKLVGAVPSPALVQQVLNDAGDDPDQLPVLQHALLRTFRSWEREGGTGRIEHRHYNSIGGIENALDGHGNEILAGLSQRARAIAERVFRSLTVTQGGVALRRPRRIEQLYQIAGASGPDAQREVNEVIAAFASKSNSFFMLSSTPATLATVVDITHESLIRRWKQLSTWVRKEARSADWYADLSRDVVRYRDGEVGLWEDPQLSGIQRRMQDERWNEAWANQYRREQDPPYAEVPGFLEKSSTKQAARLKAEEEQRNRELRHAQALARSKRKTSIALAFLLLAAVSTASVYFWQDQNVKSLAQAAVNASRQEQESSAAKVQLEARLRELESMKSQGNTSVEDRATLVKQIEDTTKQIADTRAREKASQDELATLRKNQSLSESDRGKFLQTIDDLRKRLSAVTTERDNLLAAQGSKGSTAANDQAAPIQVALDKWIQDNHGPTANEPWSYREPATVKVTATQAAARWRITAHDKNAQGVRQNDNRTYDFTLQRSAQGWTVTGSPRFVPK